MTTVIKATLWCYRKGEPRHHMVITRDRERIYVPTESSLNRIAAIFNEYGNEGDLSTFKLKDCTAYRIYPIVSEIERILNHDRADSTARGV